MLTAQDLIAFTTRLTDDFAAARITAPVHFSGGNEAELIEIFQSVPRDAYVFSTWRSHYHALLHGVPEALVRQSVLNGHSINLNFPQYRFFTSGIVGGILPIACGVAMTGQEAWCFIGDMTASIGTYHDTVTYARGHNLPLKIVIEDNGLSTNTPTRVTWGTHEGAGRCQTIRYQYQRHYPHVGLSQFVQF